MTLAFVSLLGCEPVAGDPTDPPIHLDACAYPGNICTWLGSPGTPAISAEGVDRAATRLQLPIDITFASDGTAFYPEFLNHRVRTVSAADVVTTVTSTDWQQPTHLALAPEDETLVYVSAWGHSRIGVIDTSASSAEWLPIEGAGADVPLNLPSSIAFGPDGTLYFSDQANHLIRKIAPGSSSTEIAVGRIHGMVDPDTLITWYVPTPGYEGDGGDGRLAKLHGLTDSAANPSSRIAADPANHRLVFADTMNGVIRAYDLDTGTVDTIAGRYTSAGEVTVTDPVTGITTTHDAGSVPGYAGDGGDARDAVFSRPSDVAIGRDGEIYVADTGNRCVRVLWNGIVDRFAGRCGEDEPAGSVSYAGDEGAALDAELSNVVGVEVDSEGNVYVADTGNHVIRRVKYGSVVES